MSRATDRPGRRTLRRNEDDRMSNALHDLAANGVAVRLDDLGRSRIASGTAPAAAAPDTSRTGAAA
jgi:hypothetical protein